MYIDEGQREMIKSSIFRTTNIKNMSRTLSLQLVCVF